MKKTIFYSIILTFSAATNLKAQNDVDALRYSQTGVTGTARSISMAGAFGALGGDIGVLATNPAAIGVYRKSEFSFTPSLYFANSKTSYLDNKTNDSRFNFNFGNLGFVATHVNKPKKDKAGWQSYSFGFGYNRLNSFQNKTFSSGFNTQSSLLDHFLETAEGKDPSSLDPLSDGLAYNTYLLNQDSLGYYTPVPVANMLQRRRSLTKGASSEIDLSFGGNYNDKIYIGATIGFASIRYIENTSYEEKDENNVYDNFDEFSYSQDFKTSGTGINFKLGLIYRPVDAVRVGVAVHTPTLYSMHDEFNYGMISDFSNQLNAFDTSANTVGEFDYSLTTPAKAIFSLAFIIGKSGAISADYEYSDYSTASFDSDLYGYYDENDAISKKYRAAGTLRVGAEWVIKEISIRGGVAMFDSPFNSESKPAYGDGKRMSYTGGIGIRDGNYFIDLGYAYTSSKESLYPYTLKNETAPIVKNDFINHNVAITFGVKF